MTKNNLPQNWKTVKLGEVCDLIKDGTHGTHKDYADGIPLLSAKDVNYGQIFIPNDCRKISLADFQQIHKNYSLQNNDVVLTIVGTIGRTGIVKNYNNSYTFQRSVAIFRIKKTENFNYCFHYFNSRTFQLELEQKTNSSAQGGIYLKSLSETTITLPPLPEQTRIAGCLSKWDEGIEKLKNLIEAKKKLKKGLMQRLLSPENPLAGFEGVEWRSVRLGEVCEFSQGVQVDLELQLKEPKENYVRFLRIENYTQQSDDFRYVPMELSKNKIISKDDVVVVRYGTVGFIGRGFSGALANNLFKVDPNLQFLTTDFLYVILKSDKSQSYFLSQMQNTTMPALSFKIAYELELHLPPLKTQQKIAQILSKADAEIELLGKKLANLQLQKSGLMQVLLSGKVRFKEFIN